jgi:hypothetical protein
VCARAPCARELRCRCRDPRHLRRQGGGSLVGRAAGSRGLTEGTASPSSGRGAASAFERVGRVTAPLRQSPPTLSVELLQFPFFVFFQLNQGSFQVQSKMRAELTLNLPLK